MMTCTRESRKVMAIVVGAVAFFAALAMTVAMTIQWGSLALAGRGPQRTGNGHIGKTAPTPGQGASGGEDLYCSTNIEDKILKRLDTKPTSESQPKRTDKIDGPIYAGTGGDSYGPLENDGSAPNCQETGPTTGSQIPGAGNDDKSGRGPGNRGSSYSQGLGDALLKGIDRRITPDRPSASADDSFKLVRAARGREWSWTTADTDASYNRLPLGNIAFNSPKAMRLNQPVKICLLVSQAKTLDELKTKLNEESDFVGDKEGYSVKISDSMSAHLSDDSGFEIKADHSEKQAVGSNDIAEWTWNVKPISPGPHKLRLIPYAILPERTDYPKCIGNYKIALRIEESLIGRLVRFLSDNWQWLCVAIIFPVGRWIWVRLGRKNGKDRSLSTSKKKRRGASK